VLAQEIQLGSSDRSSHEWVGSGDETIQNWCAAHPSLPLGYQASPHCREGYKWCVHSHEQCYCWDYSTDVICSIDGLCMVCTGINDHPPAKGKLEGGDTQHVFQVVQW